MQVSSWRRGLDGVSPENGTDQGHSTSRRGKATSSSIVGLEHSPAWGRGWCFRLPPPPRSWVTPVQTSLLKARRQPQTAWGSLCSPDNMETRVR